jgi:hypothetical protein
MKTIGKSALNEFLGDFVVYRNLAPVDNRLPSLGTLREELGLPPGLVPRKSEPEYARVVAAILKRARELTAPGVDIRRVVFLGDTRLLDANAFSNICKAGGWPGIAFIGSENTSDAKIVVETSEGGQKLFLSNRWAALDGAHAAAMGVQSFQGFCTENGFEIDAHTALLIDIDKTALGARGRNAATIDNARVQAVFETVADLLGSSFDSYNFRVAYDLLVQPEFHHFTEDNQDYLAYVCLVLGSGLYQLEALVEDVHCGKMKTIKQFFDSVEANKKSLSLPLQSIHTDIFNNFKAGDPTPFKSFRFNEYRITVSRMGFLDDAVSMEKLLKEEIVITGELRAFALAWKEEGALVFGLSDKPDEASLPRPEQVGREYVPLHRKLTHVVSE